MLKYVLSSLIKDLALNSIYGKQPIMLAGAKFLKRVGVYLFLITIFCASTLMLLFFLAGVFLHDNGYNVVDIVLSFLGINILILAIVSLKIKRVLARLSASNYCDLEQKISFLSIMKAFLKGLRG